MTTTKQIPQRSKSQAELAKENTVLRKGESSFLDRTGILKVGDGVTPWNDLPPFSPDLLGGDVTGVGVKGDKGDKGDPGVAGAPGPAGAKGDKGDPGVAAAPGPKGDPGDPGAAGATGPKGDKGDPGDPGAAGPQGAPGADGAAGPQGAPGAAGPQGAPGADGAVGPQGAPGNVELFFAEDATAVNSMNNVRADIPGTAGTFTVPAGGRPVHADYGVYMRTAISGGTGTVMLVIDGVDVANSVIGFTSGAANAGASIARKKRLVLTPGDHTCKLVIIGTHATSNSTAKGDAGAPTYLSLILA